MKDQQWAALIDLDQTLVETSALAGLRDRRKWSQAYQVFHLTGLFPGTHQFLQDVRTHPRLCMGVVTASPRPYAERLLAYHGCRIPVVVAYHDVSRQKPFPDPLLKAAEHLGVPITRCFHIGDRPLDIVAAQRACALPIGLCWDQTLRDQQASLPACPLCSNWRDVFAVITSTIAAQEE